MLVIVLITKFLVGAWIAIVAMVIFYLIMRGIRRHYDNVEEELAADEDDKIMPTRVHAIVLVSKLHKPTLRALAFAKATRPNVLEGVYVSTSPADTNRLLEEWDQRRIDVPLKVLHSPYRELIRPIVEYATEIKQANPRGVVAVYIPEYVVGRWWEQLLHNQTALRLKGRLLFTPGVMVTSVPYQLRSSEIARERELREEYRVRPGDLRRGEVDRRGKDRYGRVPLSPARRTPHPPTAGAGPTSGSGTTWWSERVAHGGHCVARLHATDGPGRVIFVRHALPGERVVVEITEGTDGDRFWRGDAVEVPEPSPDRVDPPCPYAGPGRCGGCDFQHVTLERQRSLKADVVREQLSRLAGLELDVTVEAVPGRPPHEQDGLRWRTRQRYVDAARRPARDAQAPVARRGRGRRLPDRRRAGRPHRARHRVRGGRRRLLAGAPGRPRGAGRHRAGLPGPAAGGVGARPVRRRRAVRPVPGRRRGRPVRA